jgi:hypothetical protein
VSTPKVRKPENPLIWKEDLVALLIPRGFEMGFSSTTAYGTDKNGELWQVAAMDRRGWRTYWFKYGTSLDHASEKLGWMGRDQFEELFPVSGATK